MYLRFILSTGLALALVSVAFAHTGVKDPSVMARMHLMKDAAHDFKTVQAMVNGTAPFDVVVVAERGRRLAEHAQKIGPMFKDQATDPKTEALDTIWVNWDDFVSDAETMERAALALTKVDSLDTLKPAFFALGESCNACHQDYRVKK